MKKLMIVAALLATACGTSALAQTAQPTSSTNTPQPTTSTPCAGNVCPGTTSWTIGGQTIFGGAGASVFEGATGSNNITKKGSGGIDIAMKAAGNGCVVDCTTSSFTFNGFAREHVTVDTTAAGGVSGVPVMAQNQGQAIGALNFTMQRLQGAPTTSAPTHK